MIFEVTDADTALALRGVHAGYPGAPGVLDCVSLTIGTGRRIAILGANGSGKTTTLYASMSRRETATTNIMTVEDPIEYDLSGIGQTQVNERIGMTFARALRSILRQDPDVIMIGEIRDLETAQMAVQASLTGHLVLSTLHTNSAIGAITRLVDMGVEPYLVNAAVEAVKSLMIPRAALLTPNTQFMIRDAVIAAVTASKGYRKLVSHVLYLVFKDTAPTEKAITGMSSAAQSFTARALASSAEAVAGSPRLILSRVFARSMPSRAMPAVWAST